MSPTIFRAKGFRFFFFSREETRVHVHVICGDGEAKYWLEPAIELAKNSRLSQSQLNEIKQLVEEHQDEFKSAWKKHFPS
jgi:diadenosine tetraphosphate (Ap4A) HIT family hydrolase